MYAVFHVVLLAEVSHLCWQKLITESVGRKSLVNFSCGSSFGSSSVLVLSVFSSAAPDLRFSPTAEFPQMHVAMRVSVNTQDSNKVASRNTQFEAKQGC